MEDIRIVIDTNAQEAGKSFDDLGKKFKDTTNDAEDLRKQIKGLKDELYKLTPGTEEYGRVLQELGGKMDQLSDTSQELKVATGGLDAVFQSTTNATASMAAGFTAATGVVALFGGENEDLQKTFVKLQAVMAIMNGMKGFAGFAKATKQASISLKAFIAQSALARKTVNQQTTATATLATTEKAATVATGGLSTAFKALTAAIASNPIGLMLVALTSLVLVIQNVSSRMKEASEAQDEWNKVTEKGEYASKTYVDQLKEEETLLERKYTRMKAAGISQEAIVEQQIKDYTDLKNATEAEKKAIEDLNNELENRSGWDKYWNGPAITKQIKENTAEWERLDAELENINNTLNGLLDNKLPDVVGNLNTVLNDLSNEFRVKIAGGLATQGDYLQAQIDVYRKAYNDLWEIVGGGGAHAARRIKGAGTEQGQLNQELATKYQAQIKGLQVELDAYNAGVAKKARDAAQKLAEELEKNYDELINNVSNEAKDIVKKWNEVMSSLDFSTFTLLPEEERSGRLSAQALRFEAEIDKYLETWRNLAEKAKNEGKITEKQFNDFTASLNNIKSELENSIEIKFDTDNISDEVRKIGESIQNSIADIKLDNENMLKALSAGLISKEEYQEWLVKQMQEYKQITNQVVETSNPFEEAFINASKAIIPPEVENQMKSEVKAYYDNIVKEIDKGFDKIEENYKWRKDRFDLWMDEQNRSWLEGAGKDADGKNLTSYWGDSATATYNKMKEQNEKLFNLLHEQYQEEIAFLEEKKAALDGNVEAQEEYNNQIAALRQADSDALQAKNTADLAAIRQYADNIMETAGKFGDAISGLASAMGSYYGEQAEQAKEMYGENSEEYKKYLKKEGNMKIAQVWTDAATGIMTAWATSEQLGPIAGPILAAVQTAALLATATASTMQIKRQTNANASGGETTANVGQLTDRVIMAEAQNTDQTAQLNAEYNQGATRVFVTVDDINSGQDANRTAVTNNRF